MSIYIILQPYNLRASSVDNPQNLSYAVYRQKALVEADSVEDAFQKAQNHNEKYASWGIQSCSVGDIIAYISDTGYIHCELVLNMGFMPVDNRDIKVMPQPDDFVSHNHFGMCAKIFSDTWPTKYHYAALITANVALQHGKQAIDELNKTLDDIHMREREFQQENSFQTIGGYRIGLN